MKDIKIYQASLNCDYVFMNYEYAMEKGLKKEDYELVASFKDETSEDNYTILNKLWDLGNNGTLQNTYRMRSISVSDIIEIDGVAYYVDSFGFKEI